MKSTRHAALCCFTTMLILFTPTPLYAYELNDVHFHLTNYVQKGITAKRFLEIMGDKVNRVALYGIPLQQKWDHFVSGDRAPNYYLLSDAALYYYSFTDAMTADAYQRLTLDEQKRFDPMITGFNPTDMYAVDHIRRNLLMYPGVFSGIGEFSVHKEFVSSKITGHTASLKNKSLDTILDFCGETGLVVLFHNDINTVRTSSPTEPTHYAHMKALLKRHKDATVIWAHTGLGRFVKPTENHLALLKDMLSNAAFSHVYFDISWDEVAKYVVENPESIKAWADLITAYPDRFLFGTDSVAPANQKKYLKTYRDYGPLWKVLSKQVVAKVKLENYARLFDAANKKVRAWELKQLKGVENTIPKKHYYFETHRGK